MAVLEATLDAPVEAGAAHDREGDPRTARPGLVARIAAPVIRRPDRPRQIARTGERDRVNPTLWEALAVDPNLHVSPESIELQVRNLRRRHRTITRPLIKVVCVAFIQVVIAVKRLLPAKLGSERALNFLAPRFMRRWTSPETLELALRHFLVETALVNFVARNSGAPDVAEVDLQPVRAADFGDHVDAAGTHLNAVARHDANIFNLVIDLGESATADVQTPRPLHELDFSMLDLPPVDVEPTTRRFLQLDLESAVHIVVATLAVFMDFETAERAVNSFQLDETLLASIANLTGDPTFRTWTPLKFPNWLGYHHDIGRDLYWHMLVTEYAHTRLCWLRDLVAGEAGAARPAGDAGPAAAADHG